MQIINNVAIQCTVVVDGFLKKLIRYISTI